MHATILQENFGVFFLNLFCFFLAKREKHMTDEKSWMESVHDRPKERAVGQLGVNPRGRFYVS